MADALTKRTLGRTGIRVSPIGIGTGSLAADPAVTDPEAADELAVATLRAAFRAGLNYIDTAPGYRGGDSDRRVGMALREVPRDQVVLATKVGTHPARPGDVTGETATWIIEESLAVIGTEHIDIALVHDPSTMDPVLEKGGAVAALERLKEEGTVRAIGLGVQNHEYLRIGIESGRFDMIQSPYDYNLLRTTAEDLIDLATDRGLGFINAAPFLAGLLSGVEQHAGPAPVDRGVLEGDGHVREVVGLNGAGDLLGGRVVAARELGFDVDLRILGLEPGHQLVHRLLKGPAVHVPELDGGGLELRNGGGRLRHRLGRRRRRRFRGDRGRDHELAVRCQDQIAGHSVRRFVHGQELHRRCDRPAVCGDELSDPLTCVRYEPIPPAGLYG